MIASPWGPLDQWLGWLVGGILGACLGSFANVLIYRIPREQSLIKPGSRCPECDRPIPPLENIPILSWLVLGGKCRGCGKPIPVRYLLIEIVAAGLGIVTVSTYGLTYAGFAYGLLFLALLVLIIIDLEHWLLPFIITVPMTLVGLAGAVFFDLRPIADSLVGIAVGFGVFLIMLIGGKVVLKRDALGGGDVVFGAMAGVFLGWKLTLLMVFIASFLGTLAAIPILILGKKVSGKSLPFGPFLSVALVICLFLGDSIIGWYIGFLGL